MPKNKSLLLEIWDFLRVRKVWWLTPIIIMLLLVGVLIIFGQSSAVSPFIYALFYDVYLCTIRINLFQEGTVQFASGDYEIRIFFFEYS